MNLRCFVDAATDMSVSEDGRCDNAVKMGQVGIMHDPSAPRPSKEEMVRLQKQVSKLLHSVASCNRSSRSAYLCDSFHLHGTTHWRSSAPAWSTVLLRPERQSYGL